MHCDLVPLTYISRSSDCCNFTLTALNCISISMTGAFYLIVGHFAQCRCDINFHGILLLWYMITYFNSSLTMANIIFCRGKGLGGKDMDLTTFKTLRISISLPVTWWIDLPDFQYLMFVIARIILSDFAQCSAASTFAEFLYFDIWLLISTGLLTTAHKTHKSFVCWCAKGKG